MKKSIIKKALSFFLSLTMVLPTFIQVFAAGSSVFSDFPTGWSKEAMSAAVSNGLLNGRTPTTIEPTGILTRAELATVINRAFGATKMADISSFKDVSPKDWFYTEIAKAVNMQTFQGDGTGMMRPNDPITREEVFAVVARALVLETSDYSALSKHPDSGSLSAWAKPYAAILSQKGYINGDEKGNLNPKSNITREEFAQILHNIIKTYYVGSGTYTKTGIDSSLIRTSGVILRGITIEGDLIIGDGVGYGSVVLENVIIKGRLLCRGGEDSVRLVNTKVGESVVVKDVNGVVHFDNYKSEDAFKNVIEVTKATYKGDNYNISMGTGGGSSVVQPLTYSVSVSGAGCNAVTNVNPGQSYILPSPNMTTYAGFAGWKLPDGTIKNPGDSITVNSNLSIIALYTYKVEHYFETYQGSGTYVLDNTKTQTKTGAHVSVVAEPLTQGITGYVYNSNHASSVKQGVVAVDGSLVLKLYYDSTVPQGTVYTLTITGAGCDASIPLNAGDTYILPTPDMSQYAGFAGWKASNNAVVAAGTQITMLSNTGYVAVYNYRVEHYFQSALGSSTYVVDNSKTIIGTDIENALVSASALTTGIGDYSYNSSHASTLTQGNVSVDGSLVLKFYYDKIDTRVPGTYKIEVYRLQNGDINNPAEYQLSQTIEKNDLYVGDTATVTVSDELGYVEYLAISTLSGVVAADGSLVLKVYLYRIHINPIYNLDGGSVKDGCVLSDGAILSYDYFTLPGADVVEKPGFRLVGWEITGDRETVEALPGDSKRVRSEVDFTVKAVWAPLYEYKVKYYKQNIEKTDFEADENLTITRYGIDGEDVSVPSSDMVNLTGFTYSPSLSQSYLDGTVNSAGIAELRLYYTRNDIDISYSFANGGAFTDGVSRNTTVPYGSTITLPSDGEVENGFDVFLYWSVNGNDYNGGSTVTIEDYDPQGGWVFTAVWQSTTTYTVKFNSLGSTVESYTLPENTSVPQSVFDGLLLYEQSGYVENADVSPVYASNEYTHKVKFGWYYNPSTNTWQKFTSSTLVTSEIVDSNGELIVEERSPQFSIYAYVDKLNAGFTFARYYEPTVVTKDGSGNETITGTRAMDTLKNFLWDSFSDSVTPLQVSLQNEIEKGGDKAFAKLQEKGIIDANKNILPYELFVRFSQIIGEEELEEYIVDNAKESLSDNDELKDAIFEYFERMANSSNPDDVSEIKSLFKEAIDRAISSDATALDMIRDVCETSLDDPDLIKTAFADFIGYNVTVTDEDLTSAATPTIIKWTKDLINTDPTFKANVKKRLVKYITDNLVSSDGFFDDVVHYNFRGTPFEDIQKPSSGLSTTDLIVDVVKSHFEAMTPDEIAVELGYADLQALFDARKDDILTVLIDDLDNPDFFNHVVSTTDFSGYTYAEVKPASTVSIIIDFIDNSIQTMSYEELADFAGYVDSAAMLDAAVDELGDIIATDIRDMSKSAYGDVLQEFIGHSSVPDTTTSLDLFKMILTKVVSDAQTSGDYEELELMTGEDFSSMTQSEIDTFFANFSASLDDAAKVDAYVKAASFDEFEKADDLPSTPRELMARFVEIYFENDSEYALEKLGYTAIDILEKAKEYALEDAKERVADPADTFLVEQIAEHAGITYANYAAVPQNAFDLVIDVVKHKVNSSVTIDDNLAHELGYTDMNSLFAEIEHHILADVEDEIRTSTTKRNEYIAEYSGIVFTDPIEENAMDFIVQYAKAVLDPMTYDEIKAELLAFGMTEEEIDGHIEDYINDNIEEIVEDEFGYCPANIDSLNTKQFIIELVLYLFDNDADKREAIINEAVDYFVDKGDLSDFEEYVDHAIEHLRETDQLDDIIDEIIESRYRDVLDTMIHQLVSDDEFEITSDNSFILTAFEMQVKDYTFDDLIAKVPSQVFKIYPRAKLEAIYTRAYNELLLDIEEGKQANANGQTAYISTGLNFIINLVDDVYAVFRDRFAELLDEKATRNYYYRENQYLRELVRLTSVECVFDTNTGVGTGYAIKDYTDYYDLLVAIALVGDDAMKWYTEELSKDEFDQLVLDYEDLFVKYANIIADMVGDYADTGDLPDKLDNNIVKAVEKKIKEKFGDKVDKILDWYEQSPFNRDYASDDYAKLRKGVNKAFKSINITTDEAFNLIGRGYNLIVNKFDGLDGIDRITQINQDTYEVTIKGKTIRVERKNTDTYTLTVQGKEITVSRKDDGNTYEIIAGSNKVVVSRAIVE